MDPFFDPQTHTGNRRLAQQLQFILEVDKVKHILRTTRLFDNSRRENDAEHSWHIALMALVLQEHAPCRVNLERVISMLLIHDVVEIDAGDVFLYDPARKDAHLAEEAAARRLFGMLPPDQAERLKALWDEFEARTSPDACFAAALDRLEPVLQNWQNQGQSWMDHGIPQEQVLDRNAHIAKGGQDLGDFSRKIIAETFARCEGQSRDGKSATDNAPQA